MFGKSFETLKEARAYWKKQLKEECLEVGEYSAFDFIIRKVRKKLFHVGSFEDFVNLS